jgi:hypothetical protein
MFLNDDVVADGQTKPGAIAGWLGSKKAHFSIPVLPSIIEVHRASNITDHCLGESEK